MAVAGMVLGILGLVLSWLPFVGWLCALVGIILGAVGMSKAKKIGGKGKGMAIAGLVCGIIGLAIGILLFALTMMAARSFEAYVEKGRAIESSLELRSIEMKVKSYYAEKAQLPKSAPEMPGSIASVCSNPNMKFPRVSEDKWVEGWQEIGFHIDEDSRCSYELVTVGQEAKAISRCDLDCDGTASVSTTTFKVEQGNLVVLRGDASPD